MVYATYDDYFEFVNGSVPDEEFDRMERKARAVVDSRTFNRVAKNPELITENVKICICELVDLLYSSEKYNSDNYAPLASYSNDGESGSYDLSHSKYTADGVRKETRDIIYRYLGSSGLLYSGVKS